MILQYFVWAWQLEKNINKRHFGSQCLQQIIPFNLTMHYCYLAQRPHEISDKILTDFQFNSQKMHMHNDHDTEGREN